MKIEFKMWNQSNSEGLFPDPIQTITVSIEGDSNGVQQLFAEITVLNKGKAILESWNIE